MTSKQASQDFERDSHASTGALKVALPFAPKASDGAFNDLLCDPRLQTERFTP